MTPSPEHMTEEWVAHDQRRRNRHLILLTLLFALLMFFFCRYFLPRPEEYENDLDHFKYGSIGSDTVNGVPYWLWRILPERFPHLLPEAAEGASPRSYAAFGFVIEDGFDRPIGFSKRMVNGLEMVGVNCASCHTGTYRSSASTDPTIVPGMPAHQLDLMAYFQFLFRCAAEPNFTSNEMLAYIRVEAEEAGQALDPVEEAVYRFAIPLVREELLRRAAVIAPILTPEFHAGHGRVDTFNPYKALVFGYPEMSQETPGASDFPSIWNQAPRANMWLHWDGNNDSLFERNISAAVGAGVTPVSLDLPRIRRVADWLQGKPGASPQQIEIPTYPYEIDRTLASGRGKELYGLYCLACHGDPIDDWKSERVGQVEDISEIGTDRGRLDSYNYEFAANQYTAGSGKFWRFRHFRKTNGYANMPLDGIWARAPYLHNGSVPTLWDLLSPAPPEAPDENRKALFAQIDGVREELSKVEVPSERARLRTKLEQVVADHIREARASSPPLRPAAFFRGYDVLDEHNVGFLVDIASDGHRVHTLSVARDIPNLNIGHTGEQYGTELSPEDKLALLEYLKGL